MDPPIARALQLLADTRPESRAELWEMLTSARGGPDSAPAAPAANRAATMLNAGTPRSSSHSIALTILQGT